MEIDIYTSATNGEKYLSVPSGTDVRTFPFPSTLDPDLRKVSPFCASIDIEPGDHRVALNSADVIRQINQNGYAVHGATMTFTVRVR